MPSVEDKFLVTLESLLSIVKDIIAYLYEDGIVPISEDAVDFGTLYIHSRPKDELISRFLYYTSSHWVEIRKKNRKYFFCATDLLPSTAKDFISQIHKSLREAEKSNDDVLEPEDENAVWEHMFSMVRLSIRWAENNSDKVEYLSKSDLAKGKELFKIQD